MVCKVNFGYWLKAWDEYCCISVQKKRVWFVVELIVESIGDGRREWQHFASGGIDGLASAYRPQRGAKGKKTEIK